VAGGQVDAPDQASHGVGQHDDARGDQAAPVQPAGRLAELQDSLGADRLAGVPVPQIEAVQEGPARRVTV
jgi:hypothetical protein